VTAIAVNKNSVDDRDFCALQVMKNMGQCVAILTRMLASASCWSMDK
jgi:hypothetical protein